MVNHLIEPIIEYLANRSDKLQLIQPMPPIYLVSNIQHLSLELLLCLSFDVFCFEKSCNFIQVFKYNGNRRYIFFRISSKVPKTLLSPYEYSLFQIQRFVDNEKVGSFSTSV